VVRLTFSACPVWIYIQSNIKNIGSWILLLSQQLYCTLQNISMP
jgi:hypothetical protein